MESRHRKSFLGLLIFLIMTSCVTQEKLTYLQYTGGSEISGMPVRDPGISITPTAYRIMPSDVLFIRVFTPDPQWSEIFNVTSSGSGGTVTEESAYLLGYPVDDEGNIEIPFVGKVQVGGKNIPEIKTRLDSIFRNYVNDASITVRLVNNYISIIGDVTTPGRYPVNRERLNIFEALSAAGDVALYGNRQKVQLIRPSAYGPVLKEFSLKDRSILTSEYYYVMPNDVIYVPPLKGKAFQNNAAIYTLFLTTITTALVILGFFNPRY